jgi:hypothetical protein
MHAQSKLLWLKASEHQTCDLGSENFGHNDADAQHQRHYGNDDGEGFLRIFFSFLGQEARVNRNEGDGNGAARDQVGQKIGNLESSDVGVGRRSGAKCPGGIGFSKITIATINSTVAEKAVCW